MTKSKVTVGLSLILVVGLLATGCDGDSAQQALLGKWTKVSDTYMPYPYFSGDQLEFFEDYTVKVGSSGETVKYSIKDGSRLSFEFADFARVFKYSVNVDMLTFDKGDGTLVEYRRTTLKKPVTGGTSVPETTPGSGNFATLTAVAARRTIPPVVTPTPVLIYVQVGNNSKEFVRLRSKASASASYQVSLKGGEILQVISADEKDSNGKVWRHVQLLCGDGRTGWVDEKFLIPDAVPLPCPAPTATPTVKVKR